MDAQQMFLKFIFSSLCENVVFKFFCKEKNNIYF